MKHTVDSTHTEVEVVVSRTIRVGQVLKINPSEAYLGIDSGNVRILAIIPSKPDNEEQYTTDVDTDDVIRQIEEFKDVELECLTDDYEEHRARLDNQPWVLYQYAYTSDKEWSVLPLDMFIEHSMNY